MISSPAAPAPVSAAPSSASVAGAAPNGLGAETQADLGRAAHSPHGRIFAGLMRGLLPTHERQDVAAAPETTDSEPGDLKTEVLGDQLNLITASNAQPDSGSLSAFARAQGLDEAAVIALFGDMAAQRQAKTDTVQGLNSTTADQAPATATLDASELASQWSGEITLKFSTADTPLSSPAAAPEGPTLPAVMGWRWMPLPLTRVNAQSVTREVGPGQLGSASDMDAGVLGLSPASPSTGPSITPLAASTTALAMAALVNKLAPASLLPTAVASRAQPSSPPSVASTEGLNLLAPSTPMPEDAMRIRLVPAWSVVTQQLTQMSGTAMTSSWGALTAATLGTPIRSVALDLSTPLASDSEETSASGTEAGWSTGTPELNRPGATNTPMTGATLVPGMAQTLRQEHYQHLADRLGQAMAERLQSQIARGEWKLQMRLNPANLGRIDVELDMHAKGLDAVFRSENPLTRELMVQSMPKLKDTLSQSGMTVASVWVNSDAGRQSDGNPTPQKDRSNVKDNPTSAQADIGSATATKIKRSSDGFDVLA